MLLGRKSYTNIITALFYFYSLLIDHYQKSFVDHIR